MLSESGEPALSEFQNDYITGDYIFILSFCFPTCPAMGAFRPVGSKEHGLSLTTKFTAQNVVEL